MGDEPTAEDLHRRAMTAAFAREDDAPAGAGEAARLRAENARLRAALASLAETPGETRAGWCVGVVSAKAVRDAARAALAALAATVTAPTA